jgi:hypothetical protein
VLHVVCMYIKLIIFSFIVHLTREKETDRERDRQKKRVHRVHLTRERERDRGEIKYGDSTTLKKYPVTREQVSVYEGHNNL